MLNFKLEKISSFLAKVETHWDLTSTEKKIIFFYIRRNSHNVFKIRLDNFQWFSEFVHQVKPEGNNLYKTTAGIFSRQSHKLVIYYGRNRIGIRTRVLSL